MQVDLPVEERLVVGEEEEKAAAGAREMGIMRTCRGCLTREIAPMGSPWHPWDLWVPWDPWALLPEFLLQDISRLKVVRLESICPCPTLGQQMRGGHRRPLVDIRHQFTGCHGE